MAISRIVVEQTNYEAFESSSEVVTCAPSSHGLMMKFKCSEDDAIKNNKITELLSLIRVGAIVIHYMMHVHRDSVYYSSYYSKIFHIVFVQELLVFDERTTSISRS